MPNWTEFVVPHLSNEQYEVGLHQMLNDLPVQVDPETVRRYKTMKPGTEYHKIQTVYARDPDTNYKTLKDGVFSLAEFECLADAQWVFTEKVDGTNIRLHFPGTSADSAMRIGGRTDSAQIPAPLVQHLRGYEDKGRVMFNEGPVTLYGEGFGGKIQKAGETYGPEQRFVLFDVRIGEWWLRREAVASIADNLGMQVVPVVDSGTLYDAVYIARSGFNSAWGDFEAEGLIMRPTAELFTRRGDRVIAKIKCRDFRS